MHVLPIASGKGGVGKSLIAANLAIALGQAGKKVLLVDMDLGASNLHHILGIGGIKQGIGTFLSNQNVQFEDILVGTNYDNLIFVPGDAEIPGLSNIKSSQKSMLIRRLYAQEVDFCILDLGAGSGFNILDFFLGSSEGIIVTAPTLTSTLNAYLFLKNAVFRIMHTSFKRNSPAYEHLEELRKDGRSLQRIYIPKLLEKIRGIDRESHDKFKEKLEEFHPRMIINMLEDPKDATKATKLRRSCREYLNIDIEHLGVMYRDHLQDIALSSRLPILVYKPRSVLSQAIYRIADKLLQMSAEGQGPLDLLSLDETYMVAGMEAEIDFENKLHELEHLLNTGALSTGDLIETIKAQQYEINGLKKENQLLKSKLVKAINQGFKA